MALTPLPHPRKYIPRRSFATQSHQAYAFPSPIAGLDSSSPLPGGNPQTAIVLNNLIPRDLGCMLRKGYRRWVSNMGSEIRSLMTYRSPSESPKHFAANSVGNIYDVTMERASSVVPTTLINVPSTIRPGEWTSLNYTTNAGQHFLVAVNPGGGYWTYDGVAWLQHTMGSGTGQISNVDPTTFNFVTVFKTQLVFTQTGTNVMWALPTGVIAGNMEEFDVGSLFPNGGSIAAVINWTFDGSAAGGLGATGGGMDNKLVIISTEGDVLVYGTGMEGLENAGFALQGRWYIGRVPVGHRFFTQYNADIAIISERGLSFMTELMRGEGFYTHAQAAARINSEVAAQVAETISDFYWEVKFLPHEQLLVIKVPELRGVIDIQWAFEVNNKAFCMLRGYPMNTVDTFNGRSYGGDYAGNVWLLFEGESDGEVDDVPGKDLQGSVVTSFQTLGEGTFVKRFLMVKPSFIANTAPGVIARLNAEWNLQPPNVSPPFLPQADSFWDIGLWDVAKWAGTTSSYEAWVGAVGTGRYGSLSMRVRGAADTIFVGWQAVVEGGGIL
jgi:hypothetical protein